MESEFVTVLIVIVISLVVIVFSISGVDAYFETSSIIDFKKILKANSLFVLGSIITMVVVFAMMLSFDGYVMKFFSSDASVTVFGLLLSAVIMFFIKNHLIASYNLRFEFAALIILIDILAMMLPPFMIYMFLVEFGKAFRH